MQKNWWWLTWRQLFYIHHSGNLTGSCGPFPFIFYRSWRKAAYQPFCFIFWIYENKCFFSASSVSQEFCSRKPSLDISSCSMSPLFIRQSRYFIWWSLQRLGISWCLSTHSEYFLASWSHSWKWSRGKDPLSGALAIYELMNIRIKMSDQSSFLWQLNFFLKIH